MNTQSPDDQTVINDTRLWLEKAVIGLNLCPFAKAPYIKNRVRIAVSHAAHLDGFLQDLDNELQRLHRTPIDECETALLVHPTLFPDFLTFNDMLNIADRAIIDNDLEGIIQIAPFHPHFYFSDSTPDDIGNYTNRSPYPTLHLIREDSIARAVAANPDTDAIFRRNIALLESMGETGLRELGLPAGCLKTLSRQDTD